MKCKCDAAYAVIESKIREDGISAISYGISIVCGRVGETSIADVTLSRKAAHRLRDELEKQRLCRVHLMSVCEDFAAESYL